jgi:hypothetical protein
MYRKHSFIKASSPLKQIESETKKEILILYFLTKLKKLEIVVYFDS